MKINVSRRKLLASSMILGIGQFATKSFANTPVDETDSKTAGTDSFTYEVNYTEDEWKNRLTPKEFAVMRLGGTERRKSSPLWEETRDGFYHCKGCELKVYNSQFKVILDKGWTFFKHCENDSVLTKIEFVGSFGRSNKTATEAHCRRCGSHLGHIYIIEGQILHCINGTSLIFEPTL